VLMAIDAAIAERLGPAWQEVRAQANASPALPALLLGILYGGLAEEVMMRWGLMSLVVWCVLRVQRRGTGGRQQLSPAAAWTGIVVASTVFAVGHLPALAQSVELSAPIVARTLALNLLAGIAYGWLFWRRSLETAMLAHATTHIGFAVGRWIA
jgi:membrane protease YdiL (CAAX protease family)